MTRLPPSASHKRLVIDGLATHFEQCERCRIYLRWLLVCTALRRARVKPVAVKSGDLRFLVYGTVPYV